MTESDGECGHRDREPQLLEILGGDPASFSGLSMMPFPHVAEQQKVMLEQILSTQAQTSQRLWDQDIQTVDQNHSGPNSGGANWAGWQAIKTPKMSAEGDAAVYLNAFKQSACAVGSH